MAIYHNDRDTLYELSPNTKIVQSGQSIQSVIDSCPTAEGSLKAGFTNPYVVRVPPGHEKEYYSLVRNAGDTASDKRNVKVVFEDNPEGKFQIASFNSCENLTDWSVSGGTMALDESHRFCGDHCIKITNVDSHAVRLTFSTGGIDLRQYQGILCDVELDTNFFVGFNNYILGGENYTYQTHGMRTKGVFRGTVFFSLFPHDDATYPDITNIDRIRFQFTPVSATVASGYIDNIRFVRTTPAFTAVLRYDDTLDDHWIYINELDKRNWKGAFLLIGNYIDGDVYLTANQIKAMNDFGHCFVNHTVSHPSLFDGISNTQANYEIMSVYDWLILSGVKKGFGFFAGPGGRSHIECERCAKRQGGMNIYPAFGTFPADVVDCDSFSTTQLAHILSSQKGGIVQIMMHRISAANFAQYQTMLEYIESHFSHIISLDEISGKYPSDWPAKFNPSFAIYDHGKTETLSGNITLKPWEGKTFNLDPGGAGRNVIPVADKGTVYQLGKQIILVNTADAIEVLIFDPTFTVAGNQDGDANADFLTDNDGAWTVGQLVGRTVNNTTDGSSGVITANTATTVTAVLSGGTDNDWDVNDAYTITPVGLNQTVRQDQRATFVYDGEGWDIVNFYDKTP